MGIADDDKRILIDQVELTMYCTDTALIINFDISESVPNKTALNITVCHRCYFLKRK